MKHTHHTSTLYLYQPQESLCPNAADEQYFADKALNLLMGIVSVAGFVCAICFLVTLA